MTARPTIILVTPEIPGNTGAIGRTCVALDMELVLIHPLGFEIDERRVRRAGLDYWKYVQLSEYPSWDAFIADRRPRDDQLFIFEEYGAQSFYDAEYPDDAMLVFGRETTGLPASITAGLEHRMVNLPMRSDKIRSLNLANTVTAAAYQALRASFTA